MVLNNRKKRNFPRFWIRDIFKRWKDQGAFHNLMQEMRLSDNEKFVNYLRINITFLLVLNCHIFLSVI